MNDTSPEMQAKMVELISKKSPAQRLAMGSSMFDFSKRLIIRALLEKNPHLSPQELKVELFKIFYGNDFSAEQRERIIRRLRSTASGNQYRQS